MFAYIGSRTTKERNARGEGISVFQVKTDGRLVLIQVLNDLVNPSYLTINKAGNRLYTVHGDQQEASSFRIGTDGRLTFINTVSFEGKNPVHLSLDPSEQWLLVTAHLAGKIVVLPVLNDGSLGLAHSEATTFGPPGPHRQEQPFAKPHFNLFDPSGQFVIVPDKGVDRTFTFRFEDGEMQPTAVPFVQAREGAGPRTAVFHPQENCVYILNELDSTLTTYAFNKKNGAMTPLSIHATLEPSFTGNNRAGGIQIDRSGTRLYVSNRGNDSIALFRLDSLGKPSFWETVDSGGQTPRFFTLSPNEKTLYSLNEDSDNIVEFSVDIHSGKLSATGRVTHCGSPVCMVFKTSAVD